MSENNAPKDPWVESAHTISGCNIDMARGGVQVVGKHAVLLGEAAVYVPFSQLFQIVASLLMLMDARQPAHMTVRRALLGSEGEPELADDLRKKIGLADDRQLTLVPKG